MIDSAKYYIKQFLQYGLYAFCLFASITTIFRDIKLGINLLVFFAPQPNIWYRFQEFPFGSNILDILFLSAILGVFYQRKSFRGGNGFVIVVFIIISYFALWNSSFNYNLPLPLSLSSPYLSDFKNYIQMIFFYFLLLAVAGRDRDRKKIIILMCCVLLLIALRNFRNFTPGDSFSWEFRASGPFWMVGLGANHAGAFFVDYASVFLGLFLLDNNKWRKCLYIPTLFFSLYTIFFSYSRGAYAALVAVLLICGTMVNKKILVGILIVIAFWQVALPRSVVDRISMTQQDDGQMENSAGGRLELWDLGFELFLEHPIFGAGYAGYELTYSNKVSKTGNQFSSKQDIHNFHLRTLCEQGIVGMIAYWLLFLAALRSGMKLYRHKNNPFSSGLGLGFMLCVISVFITNIFGDRWSYFCLGSYFWIFWGIVDGNLICLRNGSEMEGQGTSSPGVGASWVEKRYPFLAKIFN
ncbi:MAG: O-antigen ligase family protein [Bacteroidales bacterium]|nr:O-antigen ligase family protein [Bacteroidales bacterium]